jgi:uncharacterized protein
MNICVILNTPAQVHFYRNIIKKLELRGHNVTILAREYGETINLLNDLKIDYIRYNFISNSPLRTLFSFPLDIFTICKILINKKIDIFLGFGMYDVFSAVILRSKSIVFYDSEPGINFFMNLQYKMFMPFVNSFISPASFKQNVGKKHVRVDSFKELSYLHPRYFKPDDSIYDLLKISPPEDYVVLRFNNFDAIHDISKSGFSFEEKIELTTMLSKMAHVYVSAEGKIPQELEPFRLRIPKNRIHDLLYFSKLLVTDTQTMATEAAILGTPVIRKNKFVGKSDMGNFIDLEKKYGLMYNVTDFSEVKKIAVEILTNKDSKKIWEAKRSEFLLNKVDIVDFMVSFVENFEDT